MLAEIFSGERDTSDAFFLIAIVLFVIYALFGWSPRADARVSTLLLGLGLACVAFALMLL